MQVVVEYRRSGPLWFGSYVVHGRRTTCTAPQLRRVQRMVRRTLKTDFPGRRLDVVQVYPGESLDFARRRAWRDRYFWARWFRGSRVLRLMVVVLVVAVLYTVVIAVVEGWLRG